VVSGLPLHQATRHSFFYQSPSLLMNLILIGYRGTGKTTVARRLALRLGWDWADADVEIELAAGKSIAAIFERDGEAVFRHLEAHVLAELTRRDRLVLAAGGGAVLREQNRLAMRQSGKVVWLKAGAETIHERIAADENTAGRRPNLTIGGLAEIIDLLDEREALYRSCSDFSVDTEDKSPEEVVQEILDWWNQHDDDEGAA
jgi:shikimate kinase